MRRSEFSKITIFFVCILLVFAVSAALIFNSASMSANDKIAANAGESADEAAVASYPVSADGYTHGSNIGRATSGTVYDVSNASDLATRISNNQNIRLTGPITVTSFNASSYSGTIYGNGQTVTINYTSGLSTGASENEGGIVGTLTGSIYDLNVVVQSNTTIKRGRNASPSTYNMGLIAGNINGGTISNCAVTINSGVTIWAFSWRAGDYASFGGVVGRVTSGTISNVTVTNNGSIKAGNAKDGDVSDVNNQIGVASNVAGYINNNSASLTISLSNIIVAGSGTISSYVAANIGLNVSSGKAVNVQNFYNKFTGTYKYATLSGGVFGSDTPLVAYTIFKWAENSDGSTVTNYYASGADESMMKTGFYAVPDSSVEVGGNYSIYFDPKASSTASSLVVVKTGVTGGEGYSATIANVKSTPYVYTDNYAFSADGRTVIFRNLSTTASDWNSGGNFACTINIKQDAIQVDKLDPVNKWESSHTTSQSSSGTAVDNGSKLTTAINNNQNIYLTDDITDFKGFTHTGTYSGTLDGNGHTIYIVNGGTNSTDTVGGLFGTFTGTIKNVRIVLYTSYNRTVSANKQGTGIVAGNLQGTVDNVYVYIPDGVTFGVTGTQEGYVGAIAGVADGTDYTIKNTTVDIEGKMHLDGSWVYMAGFVGKSSTGSSSETFYLTNNVFKGNGSFSSSSSNSTEPIYLAATTVLFEASSSNPQSTININGFINAFKGGETNLTGGYSMYGVLTKNDNSKVMSKWTWNVSGVYDYDSPWGDINKKGTSTGNNYIDVSAGRYTVSMTVKGSSVKVMPYFPAGDTTNLVLVAGDGSQSVPDLVYGEYSSAADGNYKVVTVPKTAITYDVVLSEPVIPAEPIENLNKWENGYTTESGSDGTPVANGAELEAAIAANENIYLTGDVFDFVGFGHTSTYSGTLDGNGHTIYIVKASAASGNNIGGLFSTLTGTVKNVRIVVMDGVDLSATNYVGGVAGALSVGATVSNVNVIINQGVDIIAAASGDNAGGAGGIAGAVINGATTVTINNSTVELNGSLESNAKWTFVGGFVGHLNGGTVNFRDITFKGNGALNGSASGGEGVHTAGAAVIGGGVDNVSLDGMINGYTGTKTANKSAYAITFVRNGNNAANPTFANIYTYGGDFSNEGGMTYGTPVDISSAKSQISATVADTSIPVKAYFPVNNNGELVLAAGDGTSECPFVTYNDKEGVKDGNYMVVSVPKNEIAAQSNIQLIQGKSPVNDPTLATSEEELVYKGGEIDVAINQLTAGATALSESDYTVAITENGGNALVQNGKPVNAGNYVITITLLNGYEFEDGSTEKTLEFTVTPFEISGTLSISGNAEYDKTEKTVIFTADENKGLFNGDNVFISYNDGDRVNVTEAGFTATAAVPNSNYSFADGNAISAKFNITAKEVAVVWGETSFIYDGSEKVPTAEVTEGVVDGDSVTLAVSGGQTSAGQNYTATAAISPENPNYVLTNDTVQFSVAKAKVTVNGKNVTVEYKAEEYTDEEIKAAVFTDGMPDGATTTITVTPESVVNAGDSATVTVALVDGNNYEFEADATTQFTFTVTAKAISLPEGSSDKNAVYSPSATYTAAQITELVFGTASIENVTVKVMNVDVEISGDTAVSDAGVYTVIAEANANYVFADGTTTEYTFEITKAPITLGVSVQGWTYGEAASDSVITGNDGNGAVTYLYTGTDYSGAVAPTDAGEYSLEITVEETANYQGSIANCEFTIEKAVVTVPTIEDKAFTGDILTADVEDTQYYTVKENKGGSEVATYNVVLTLRDANNYKWSDGTETADITLEFHIVASGNSWIKEPSITGWIYGQYSSETNAPDYEAEKGNDTAVAEYKLKTEADTAYRTVEDLSALNAGIYNMRVRVPKTDDYGGLSKVVEFTVEKASVNISVTIDGWTYGEAANLPTVDGNTASGEVTYSYEGTGDTVYKASAIAPTNAGTYKVTATVAETDNYFGATAEAEFTIAKKAITATVSAENAEYDGTEHVAQVAFDGKLESDEMTANLVYNGEAVAPVDAGTYTVTAGSYGGVSVANYEITTAEGEVILVISPKKLYIGDIETTAVDPSDNGVYNGKEHAVKATVKRDALYGDDTVTLKVLYNGSESAPVNAGNYKLTFVVTDNGNYVMADDQSKDVPVFKAKVTVRGANATAVYTGEAFSEQQIISAVFGGEDLSLVNVTVTYRNGEAAIGAGDIADVEITLKDETNYEFKAGTMTAYTFTVTAGTVSISGENATAEYRGTAYTEEEIKKAVFGENNWADFVIGISYNNVEALNAGDVATLKVTGYSDPNYSLDPEMTTEYTFTVETLKVAAPQLESNSFVYNGEAQTIRLVDDTYVGIRADIQTDKGDYNAVAALKDKNNYEWIEGGNADVELQWSITAKEITLKAETSVEKVYDGKAYDFSGYNVTGADGFYERDGITVSVSAGDVYTPGAYVINVVYDRNDNYSVTVEQTEAILTITTATLTVTAKEAEIEYTGNLITFEFEITDGKVSSDDVQIDGVTYRLNGIAVAPQQTGTYEVTFTLKGAQSAYYTAASTQVKVTPQTATAPDGMTADSIAIPDGTLVYNGEAYTATLNYEATDGNTYGIVYHNGSVYVDNAVNAGEYTVYVYKNTKSNIVEGISKTMTVEKRELSKADIVVGGLDFTYSGGANRVNATGSGVKGEDVTLTTFYDGESGAPVNAGSYTVTFMSADGNYTVADGISYTMTVARASVITPVADELIYNGEEQIAFAESDKYSVGGVYAATDVSADGYTAVFTLTSDNYKWAGESDETTREISVTWNIAPKSTEIAVSDADKSRTYDGRALTEEELKALFTAPDKIGGGKVDIAVKVNDGAVVLNAGTYEVTATITDINYIAEQKTTVYTVNVAEPSISVKAQEKLLQIGDRLATVGIYLDEGSTAGTVVWDDPEITLSEGENVVFWTFTPDDKQNYNGSKGSLTLTVGDEVLTAFEMINGPDKTEYLAFDTFDPTGIVLKATFDGVYEQEVTIAECEVIVENATADGKLTAETTVITLRYGNMEIVIDVTVEKLTVEIPALDKTELEYNATEQRVNIPEDPRYYLAGGNIGTNVGSYYAAVALTDKVNYKWSDGMTDNRELSWKITPVTLSGTITLPENLVYDGNAKIATFTLTQGTLYGGAQMAITYELTDGTVLDGAPVNAGDYEVVATLPDTVNYRFAAGTEYSVAMTIAKKAVIITTNGDREKYFDGVEVTVAQLAENFSVTDGLSVSVTVSGKVLDAGSYIVTANVADLNSNYTAQPVSYKFTVRKGNRNVSASLNVGYRFVEISAAGGVENLEYSLDGNVWNDYSGAIEAGLQATYTYYVRYAESKNYNTSNAVKVQANITKAALAEYVEERFVKDVTLADAADIAMLEKLAENAAGENAEFDAKLAELSAERERLVSGATNAVENALMTGGALRGYGVAVASAAIALGGISVFAAAGLCLAKRKGGKKNEEK